MALRSNELMIGDWVYKDNMPVQILALNLFVGKEHEDIKPIPLTPEILLKNGFEFRGEGKARKPYQMIDDGLYISWWNNRLVIRYKRESGRASNYLNLDCRYVHDLQHCLRMAGIDNPIEL